MEYTARYHKCLHMCGNFYISEFYNIIILTLYKALNILGLLLDRVWIRLLSIPWMYAVNAYSPVQKYH